MIEEAGETGGFQARPMRSGGDDDATHFGPRSQVSA